MGKQRTRIICDSCVDLPREILDQHFILCIPMNISLGNEQLRDGVDITPSQFYQRMRAEKIVPTTSQITPAEYGEWFRMALNEADEAVYIGLSSGLTGSMQNAFLTAQSPEFAEKVQVVDSLGASVGLGLMVLRAAELAQQGMSAEAIAREINAYRKRICHIFTLDTLEFAHRGGRVSAVAAAATRLLDVKVVLHVDMEGHLVPIDRVRGRKRAINRLFEEIERLGADVKGKRVGVNHADAPADAEAMAEHLRSHYGAAEVVIGEIGPTIGTHTGPGCVSIFFEGPEGRSL